MTTGNKRLLVILLAVVAIGTVYFFVPVSSQITDQIFPRNKYITDTAYWNWYVNEALGYSLKYPRTYQILHQTEIGKGLPGVDYNVSINKKSDPSDSRVIMINVTSNNEDLSLGDYVNKNLTMYGISGPLVSFNFNGYDSLLNKNQPGTNVFVKQGQYVYHITASTASSDKEVTDILATFKFTQ